MLLSVLYYVVRKWGFYFSSIKSHVVGYEKGARASTSSLRYTELFACWIVFHWLKPQTFLSCQAIPVDQSERCVCPNDQSQNAPVILRTAVRSQPSLVTFNVNVFNGIYIRLNDYSSIAVINNY